MKPVDIARERIASALQLVDVPTAHALLDEAKARLVPARAVPAPPAIALDDWRPDLVHEDGGAR